MKKIYLTIVSALIFLSSNVNANDTLILAGGCFWCMEAAFDKVAGVLDTESGYAGGNEKVISYNEVSSGKTNHREVLKITFDEKITNVETLLEAFWQNIDPFNPDGQFCDSGPQYKTAIFYKDDIQKALAEKSLARIKSVAKHSVQTDILEVRNYNKAEEYHQNYYEKNPIRYKTYKLACGRDKRLEQIRSQEEFILNQ